MPWLTRALLAYALALAVFLLVPPFLKDSFPPYDVLTWQEAMDLLTPLVVLPLAWAVIRGAAPGRPGRLTIGAFIVLAAIWAEAQGIHLAANAIGDANPPADFLASPAGRLRFELDEVLSHWLWHAAWVGLAVVAFARGHATEMYPRQGTRAAAIVAGIVYGATFAVVTLEGVTTALAIPASLGFAAWAAASAGGRLARRPLAEFVLTGALASLAGFAVWGLRFGWDLPEPSVVFHL